MSFIGETVELSLELASLGEATQSNNNLLVAVFQLIREALQTFLKPREGRSRLYIILSAGLFLIVWDVSE